jgi:hypothetical protein
MVRTCTDRRCCGSLDLQPNRCVAQRGGRSVLAFQSGQPLVSETHLGGGDALWTPWFGRAGIASAFPIRGTPNRLACATPGFRCRSVSTIAHGYSIERLRRDILRRCANVGFRCCALAIDIAAVAAVVIIVIIVIVVIVVVNVVVAGVDALAPTPISTPAIAVIDTDTITATCSIRCASRVVGRFDTAVGVQASAALVPPDLLQCGAR